MRCIEGSTGVVPTRAQRSPESDVRVWDITGGKEGQRDKGGDDHEDPSEDFIR